METILLSESDLLHILDALNTFFHVNNNKLRIPRGDIEKKNIEAQMEHSKKLIEKLFSKI